MRRAVYEQTPAGWRLNAHARCAEALAEQGASAGARAHHVERSAQAGDAEAIALLREAGQAALRLAPASAERWFGAALRLLPQNAPVEERIGLLMARAGARTATEQLADSRTDLLECIELAAGGAPEWRVRAATACAAVEHLLGLQTEAHDHLLSALHELTTETSAEAVELQIELTIDGFHRGDFAAMRSWAERANAGASALDDRGLLAAALAVRAWGEAISGSGERAKSLCDETARLVDQLADGELAPRLPALAYLNSAELFLDRYEACTRHARRALEICRATGQGESFPLIVAMLGSSLWVLGKIAESGEVFDGAIESARLAGNEANLAWNLFNRSFAALVAGNVELALATGKESCDLEATLEPGPLSACAAAVYAAALFEAGEADKSIELILDGSGGLELPLIPGGWRARFLEVLTRALLVAGRRAEAERAAEAARAAASVDLPTAYAFADLARADVELDAGSAVVAANRALAAVGAFESAGALFDAARARELAGRSLAVAGDREGAAVQLQLAASAFDSFGSLRYRDQVERGAAQARPAHCPSDSRRRGGWIGSRLADGARATSGAFRC